MQCWSLGDERDACQSAHSKVFREEKAWFDGSSGGGGIECVS